MNETGHFLPHLLPVDPTLHWANPPGGTERRDTRPTFASTPSPYTGPVPIVTHLHGGHNAQESDGYAEAWYLPVANDVPAGFATEGTLYDFFKTEFFEKFGVTWEPGTATFQYENDQRGATLWYHDHTLGMTRLNVYAGPAGFYLIRRGPGDLPGAVLPGPAPTVGSDPFGRFYEIPIAIQDRSFNSDGSLFYPDSRQFFDEFPGPYIPDSPTGEPLLWMDPITENPALNSVEVWEIYNFTADSHPIHIHEVQFQVVNRQPFGGAARPPESWETGLKDTVLAHPGEITRARALFDLPGLFVWHCHIVEHEDNEMMRPLFVGDLAGLPPGLAIRSSATASSSQPKTGRASKSKRSLRQPEP